MSYSPDLENSHRNSKPIEVIKDAYKCWYLNGKRHREDGPAVEYFNNNKDWRNEWWVNGELHREDGPAIEYANGDKYWYLNGKLHREDGPAVECPNAWYIREGIVWYLNGKKLSYEDWLCECFDNFSEEKQEELIFNGFVWE